MVEKIKNLMPNALVGRLVLLLAIAVIVANLIALIVLNLQQRQFDRQVSEDREIERISALIPAMEVVGSDIRRSIAQNASTRFARVRVEDAPLVKTTGSDRRSQFIARDLSETLRREDVSVAIISRPETAETSDRRSGFQTRRVIAITIPLAPRDGGPEWLNVVTRDASRRPGRVDGKPFLTVLVLSLFCVLGVGVALARRLAKPLGQLSDAAQAAGRGDRTARVPETGPREIREAARAFNTMQVEISQFDDERMRMLAAVGHDLRTPMTSLRIRAELMDDAEQRDAMVRTLDEMTVMADSLVSYAREGQDAEELQALDLGELLSHLCKDRGLKMDVFSSVEVMGRPVGLGRAFGNLIDNAVRYGSDVAVELIQHRETVEVLITDRGPGIPSDDLEDMFRPFARGDNSRNTDTGGAGLGLSIARTIIVAHRGTIRLANRTGGGLKVTVTLPKKSQ